MSQSPSSDRMRSGLIKAGAALAVSSLIVLSALSGALAASADDIVEPIVEPTAEVVAPADQPADVVDPPAEPAEPAAITGPTPAALVTPIANDDLFPGGFGTTDLLPADLYLNDSDPTSTTLEIDDPAGLVTVSGGWISVPLPSGHVGNRTFQYRTSGVNGTSNWATVTIVIAQGSAQPIAYSDSYSATSGSTLSIAAPGLMANDTTLGGTVTGLSDLTGQVVIHADGSFEYTPAAGFTGTKTFNYQLTANGVPSNWGKVTITVSAAVSSAPVAHDDFYETDQGVDLDIPANGVLANDSSSTATVFAEDDGTLETILYEDGALHYSGQLSFSGVKTFHYAIIDNGQQSNWATVTIVVHPVEPVVPVAVDDKYTMPMNTTLTVDHPGVLSNDSGGIVWWDGGFYSGSLVLYSDGSFTYTPDVGFSGTTVIQYTIRDNHVTSEIATITIEVLDDTQPTLLGADPVIPADSTPGVIPAVVGDGKLAFTGLDSTWLALPAVSIFLLGALALGFSAARRRRAGTV